MTGPVLLGVDGGNTKTIALLAGADGTILGTGRVDRRADIHAVGAEASIGVYREAAERALRAAGGRAPRDVAAAVFSLAGADWPEDLAELADGLQPSWPGAIVVNDAIGALRAAVLDGPAVVVVCGTGTATGARGPDGRTWHSSFWQEAQGAHELGVRTLQAVYRADLGIDPPTALTDGVLAATGEASVEAVLHHATGRGVAGRRHPGSLAPVLLDVADGGDETATRIATSHGASLGQMALAAARRASIDVERPFALALTGGVLRHPSRSLRDAIIATVRAGAPGVQVATPALEPAAGALLLAFDAAGIAAPAAITDRIRAGLDSPGLFDTRPA